MAAAARAAETTVVLGTERVTDRGLQITACVIDPDGTIAGWQDKGQIDPSEEAIYPALATERRVFRAGPLTFELPRCGIAVAGRVGGDWLSMQPELETIVFLPDDGVMTLSWRARLRCDRRVLEVERISISSERTRAAA